VLMLSYEYWIKSLAGRPDGGEQDVHDERQSSYGNRRAAAGAAIPERERCVHADDACPFRSRPSTIANRQARMVQVFGEDEARMSVSQAQADLSGSRSDLQRAYPKDYPEGNNYSVEATAIEEATRTTRGQRCWCCWRPRVFLLIACANVANLNLSRMVRLRAGTRGARCVEERDGCACSGNC